VAQDDENGRDAAHVTATATVCLLRTLHPNSAVGDAWSVEALAYRWRPWKSPEPPNSLPRSIGEGVQI